MSLSVRENIVALVLDALSRLGFVSPRLESSLVARQIAALAIKTPSPESRIASLSGGNQQKVLFARSLSREPAVLLADEPTRGVDAGARIEIYRILRKIAAGGGAVVVLSSDAIELQGLCDRVLVFSRGQIAENADRRPDYRRKHHRCRHQCRYATKGQRV
jgi:ribose transport system ATP-binding protein